MLRAIRQLPLPELTSPSLPEDLIALSSALREAGEGRACICVGESGTAMRFALAYLSATARRELRLEGKGRQHERPIAPLVDALRSLGGDISYAEVEGYPPLIIRPSKLQARAISLDASSSSQYLSALLLIAPLLEGGGYSIDTSAKPIASLPYAQMTIEEMREHGFVWQQKGGLFSYSDTSVARTSCALRQEADWSAASYAYMLLCLTDDELVAYTTELGLPSLLLGSSQGDEHMLRHLYARLGVATIASTGGVMLSRGLAEDTATSIELDCLSTPDLVPAMVASFVALRRPFRLSGVRHLRLKESDRLLALQTELRKLGVELELSEDAVVWTAETLPRTLEGETLRLNPHHDHRIAMALAPLLASFSPDGVVVEDADCVAKSFPGYWSEIEKLGYITSIVS